MQCNAEAEHCVRFAHVRHIAGQIDVVAMAAGRQQQHHQQQQRQTTVVKICDDVAATTVVAVVARVGAAVGCCCAVFAVVGRQVPLSLPFRCTQLHFVCWCLLCFCCFCCFCFILLIWFRYFEVSALVTPSRQCIFGRNFQIICFGVMSVDLKQIKCRWRSCTVRKSERKIILIGEVFF